MAIVGIVMVLGGISALFWNESRSAARIATALEAEDAALQLGSEEAPQSAEGDVIAVAADADADGPALDPLFGIEARALRLDRVVEMYQWREREEGSGDDRKVVYDRVWAEGRIPSERFRGGPENPPAPPFASEVFVAEGARIGRVPISAELLAVAEASGDAQIDAPPPASAVGGIDFVVRDGQLQSFASAPEIGDVRVRFPIVPLGATSALGQMRGAALGLFRASNGGELGMIEPGRLTAAELISIERSRNAKLTWGLRAAGSFAIFMGFLMTLKSLARRVPLIGKLAAKLMAPIAFVLAAVVALTTIAIGWLAFRPFASLILIGTAFAIGAALRWMRAKDPEDDLAHAAAPPPPPGSRAGAS